MASLLGALGGIIRERRRGLDLTQAELAKRCGVSLRFLGQLESGEGNISVERLAGVAAALGLPVSRLFAQAEALQGAAAQIRVALLGVRGAGKSTVGKLLAETLDVPFVELDALVERRAGLTLAALFELHGEGQFRTLQREALDDLFARTPSFVVATGGSLVTDEATYARVRSSCTTVWLKARAEDHWGRVVAQGDGRPMRKNPRAMDQLRTLLATRAPLYAEAEVVMDTSGKRPEEVTAAIRGALGR